MARIPTALTRQREELAWELRVQGMRERRIAEEIEKQGLGQVTRQAVSLMLIRVEARALEGMKKQVEGLKARQTDALWFIYEEAIKGWERSKTSSKSITKRVDTRGGDAEEGATGSEQLTTRVADQDGDPRFLDQARAALADLRKIWGVDAPSKIAPTSPNGEEEWHATDTDRTEILGAAFARLGFTLAPARGDGAAHGDRPSLEGAGPDLPQGGH